MARPTRAGSRPNGGGAGVLLASAAWLEAEGAADATPATAPPITAAPVTQAHVAAHARTDAVMTSEVLRTLEGRSFVRRRPHPTDARAERVVVTPAGRRLARA